MNRGIVALRKRGWRMPAALVLSFAFCSQAVAQPHVVGRWDEPPPVNGDYAWPSGAMHCILLASGKVLYWYSPGCGTPETYSYLWDPKTGSQTRVPNTGIEGIWDCNAQSQLANGDLLVVGGGCGPVNADNQVRLFRLAGSPTGPWQQLADMAYERWYPTSTTLADGRVLVTSGIQHDELTQQESVVEFPEIYNPNPPNSGWQTLLTASLPDMPTYPFMFVLPGSGDVFFAGPVGFQPGLPHASVLDTSTWTWSTVSNSAVDYWGFLGSAVMYEPGKILKAGGADGFCGPQTGVAAIIDMTQQSPAWQQIDSLSHPRKDLNLVVGPTGVAYAIGGQANPCPGDCSICDNPTKWAESIDLSAVPLEWIELAEATIARKYHSTALLLPDGRILSCGGESLSPGPGQPPPSISAEIFSPPYLFQPVPGDPTQSMEASRPQIGYAPSEIFYDTQFTVSMPEPLLYIIGKVSLIRLGAVTHGFDMDQRYVPLEFTQFGFNVQINAPDDGTIAPPGYYMLFVVSAAGVPSEAAILKVKPLLP